MTWSLVSCWVSGGIMPSINDFPGSKKSQKKTNNTAAASSPNVIGAQNKRRPGREKHLSKARPPNEAVGNSDVHVVDVETGEYIVNTQENSHNKNSDHEQKNEQTHASKISDQSAEQKRYDEIEKEKAHHGDSSHAGQTQSDKFEIKFSGSEILRAKFPKPFAVAESIATDWLKDGNFDELPVDHPLAKYFAAKGLRKAKEIEKKVLESPVTEEVAMQALQAGMKAQEIVNQVRNKIKK